MFKEITEQIHLSSVALHLRFNRRELYLLEVVEADFLLMEAKLEQTEVAAVLVAVVVVRDLLRQQQQEGLAIRHQQRHHKEITAVMVLHILLQVGMLVAVAAHLLLVVMPFLQLEEVMAERVQHRLYLVHQ
jgi:hypothetical protein